MKNLRRGELAGGLLAVLGLVLILGSPMAFAQQGNGTVSGSVRDVSGAVVPGASVVLRNEASGTELKTTSDASGVYTINYVPVATYTLTVSSQGFKKSVQTGIHVSPSAVLDENATLQIGTQIQTVEVKSSAVNLIPKSTGGQMATIGATQIENTATLGRNALEMLTLLPGMVGGTGIPGANQNGGFDAAGGSGFQVTGGGINNFNVNGLRNDQNMIKLDNSNMIDPGANSGFAVEPNMDMIQELTVKTSGFEASQGSGGVIVDAVTKSGGSKYHGEGYWYARNSVFNANDWSNNQAHVSKPNSKFNYPGFNIGGPVRIPGTDFNKNNDKMFFFYGIELQRQLRDQGTVFRTVPTAAMRNGDFSQLLNTQFCKTNGAGVVTGGQYLGLNCIVNDMATGKPAPGNILPANEVTQDGQIILNESYVLPNYVDPTGGSNLASHPLFPLNRIENTARIDYNLTQNTRAFVRIAQNSDHEYYPYGIWAGGGGGWGGSVPRVSPVVGHLSGESASLNVVQVINPTLTNEVQFNVTSQNYPFKYADPTKVSSAQLLKDLPGFNWAKGTGGSVFTRTAEVPQVWDGINSGVGAGTWGQGDQLNGIFGDKTTFEFEDNITKVKGTHTLQFGFALNRTRNDQNQANVEGTIWTTGWGEGNSTGNTFGDLLGQGVTNYSQTTNDVDGMWRFWNYEWYAQDSWKATRKLTVNFGSRFAEMPPWYEARGKVAAFNPKLWTAANDTNFNDGFQVGTGIAAAEAAPYFPAALKGKFAPGLPSSGGFPNPGIIFEPRLAFAYDVFGTGKTVIRSGAGLYSTRDQGNTIFGAAQNPPFEFSAGVNVTTNITQPGGGFAKIATVDPLSSAGGISGSNFDQTDGHTQQSYEWNFTLDQDIGLKTVVEAAYVGNVGRHLYVQNILDPIPLGAEWTPGTQLLAPGATGNNNPYRYYKPFGAINVFHHTSTSNYNALQVTARRNVTQGLTLLASYTYSKTLGYAGSFNGTVDPFNTRLNYGLQSYDRPQNFNISYIYQLPSEGAKHFSGSKVAGGVLDGWQLSGITNFQSGAPLNVSTGTLTCSGNATLCGGSFFNGSQTWYGTPDRSLTPIVLFNPQKGSGFNGVGSNWLSPGSVTMPKINQLGTREMPQFLGPASNNFDMTLFKSFKIGEQRRIEFRWATFDIFNRSQFDNPNTGSANFTINVPANATDFSTATVSPVTNVANPGQPCANGQFGCIITKHGHREMEFALKLYF